MTAIGGNTELRSKGTKIETGQNASIERLEKSPRRRGRAPGGFELRGGPMLPESPYRALCRESGYFRHRRALMVLPFSGHLNSLPASTQCRRQ
jgi:hypothetical protein